MQTLGWDTHVDNFNGVRKLCGVLTPPGLRCSKTSRTAGCSIRRWWSGWVNRPHAVINNQTGRDHFPAAWSTVSRAAAYEGPGGRPHQRRRNENRRRPVAVSDLVATIALALGVDPMAQNHRMWAGHSHRRSQRQTLAGNPLMISTHRRYAAGQFLAAFGYLSSCSPD